MKHCIDCDHFIPDSKKCRNAIKKPDPMPDEYVEWMVNGGERPKEEIEYYFAGTERKGHYPTACGIRARYFKPKTT